MSQVYATGSVWSFCRFAGSSTILSIGTCERFPNDSRQPQFEPLMNDISGTRVPLDFAFEGADGQVSMVLTRWNFTTTEQLEAEISGDAAGTWDLSDVGTLMALEQEGTELWTVYLFGSVLAGKVVYTTNGMIPGRYYPQTIIYGPNTDETGTAPMKKHLMFFAWPKYTPSTRKFMLYSTNPTDFTGISTASLD